MSELPERIWASGGHVSEWDTHIGTFVSAADSDATEYVRADKVQALLREVRRVANDMMRGDCTRDALGAALAAFTDAKEGRG